MKFVYATKEVLQNTAHPAFVHYFDEPIEAKDGIQYQLVELQSSIQDIFVSELEDWHGRLCLKSGALSAYWWLFDASRLCIHHSYPVFRPLLVAHCVMLLGKKEDVDKLFLVDFPEIVRQILQEQGHCCESIGSGYDNSKVRSVNVFFRQLYNSAISWIGPARWFLSAMVSNVTGKKIQKQACGSLLATNLVSSPCRDNWEDHYFGKMFNDIPETERSELHWGIFSDRLVSNAEQSALMRHISTAPTNVSFFQHEIHPHLIIPLLKGVKSVLSLRKRVGRSMSSELLFGQKASVFWKYYVDQTFSVQPPIFELVSYLTFKKFLKNNPGIKRVIYPYEEKGLERGLLLAITESGRQITSVGFAHSVGWNLHRYVKVAQEPRRDPPRPQYFAVTGPIEKDWLSDFAGVRNDRIRVVGSPRADVFSLQENSTKTRSGSPTRIFFPVGQARDLSRLANWVEQKKDLFAKCRIHIRPYPFAWRSEQESGLHRLQAVDHIVDWSLTSSVDEEILLADLVIFTTTSVGFRSMLMGRYTVNVNLQDTFQWDLSSKPGASKTIEIVNNPQEFSRAIDNFLSMPESELRVRCKEMTKFAQGIYQAPSTQKVAALLKL